MQIGFATMRELFEPTEILPKSVLKQDVVEEMKQNELTGIPDTMIDVDLEPQDGSDIIIHTVTKDEALGTRVYKDANEHFEDLERELYEPDESEVVNG